MDESGKSFSVFPLSLETQVNSIMKLTSNISAAQPGLEVENNRIPRQILLCIGGWASIPSGPCRFIETFNPTTNRWIIKNFSLPYCRAYHGLEVIEDKVK